MKKKDAFENLHAAVLRLRQTFLEAMLAPGWRGIPAWQVLLGIEAVLFVVAILVSIL